MLSGQRAGSKAFSRRRFRLFAVGGTWSLSGTHIVPHVAIITAYGLQCPAVVGARFMGGAFGKELPMGKAFVLWLLGVPVSLLVILWLVGVLR
jgi:hypothetical protein